MIGTTCYSSRDGIKIYSIPGLYAYDALIMDAVTPLVWDCPSDAFVRYYRAHTSRNHADIGVGTGYCLSRCGLVPGHQRLALIDLQPNCLRYAARRLRRYSPEQHVWDVGEPLAHSLRSTKPFDSVALGGILHCLPGATYQKARVFDSIRSICNPNATIFGYTLVNDAIGTRRRRRLISRWLHRAQIVNFGNDTFAALEQELANRYSDYQIDVVGCLAFFKATAQRTNAD